ncbi:OmpA family protein [Zhongshania sp.]|uniref:OmpA family protein n=1 Tax=Zhongshania sp. TaxID=1971902 RepID=UPI0026390829|nr:OmpA family protein [Zhongshania sp.]
MSLTDELLFVFGRSREADLNPSGRVALVQFAQYWQRRHAQINKVLVVGHSDPIGVAESNNSLSQARAATVAEILVRNGIDRSVIVTMGKGSSDTIAKCSNGNGQASTLERVNCLQPDRRVSVRVLATAS